MTSLVDTLVGLYNMPSNFNAHNGRKLLDSYPDYPVYATVLYLAMVFYLPGFLKRRHWHCELRWIPALWNLALSLISTVGAYYTQQLLYEYIFVERGFYQTVCTLHRLADGTSVVGSSVQNGYAQRKDTAQSSGAGGAPHVVEPASHAFLSMSADERAALLSSCYHGPKFFYIALFLYLKTPELLDTLFLIVQDKPVSFLHWFHHILTAIYSWHAGYTLIPAGVIFTTMNYTVHSFMYFYYFLVVLGFRKKIRRFAPVITLLQCLQMFGGVGVTAYTYLQFWLGPAHQNELFYKCFRVLLASGAFVKAQVLSLAQHQTFLPWSEVPTFQMSNHFHGCDTDRTNLRMGVTMYAAYCVLFTVLFYELYLAKGYNKKSLVLARKEKLERAAAEGAAGKAKASPACIVENENSRSSSEAEVEKKTRLQ